MSVTVGDRAVRVAIREVRIAAASSIDARRLADAMPAALERELSGLRARKTVPFDRRAHPVDRVAREISNAIVDRLRTAP